MRFEEFNLTEDVLAGIRDAGFTECTDVQAETLKRTLKERDVTVQSQTGTGKTAAYLTTIFQLKAQSERFRNRPALVVAPTRELAVQIEHDAKILGAHLGIRTGCFYGGAGYVDQERKLEQGVDLIIGTPGRLLDFSSSHKLDLGSVGIVVIDEADRLFDMGFYPDIQRIFRRTGPREERLTLLFSATLSQNVLNISWKFMNDPVEIEVEPEHITVQAIDQRLYHVAQEEKFPVLLGLLEREQPEGALIFCNTRRGCTSISDRLRDNGYDSEYLIGDLPQTKRLRIIDRFKASEVRILVATDVAARGLHIEGLPLVVNYDLPEDAENYVHRIGRTARVGKSGKAISLACERFVYGLEAIESYIGMKIASEQVDDEMLATDHSRRRGPDRDKRSDRRTGRDGRKSEAGPRRGRGSRRPSAEHAQAPGAPSHGRRADSGAGGAGRKPGGRPKHEELAGTGKPIPADTSLEERLRRYREKYGEEFQPVDGPAAESARDAAHEDRSSGEADGSSRRRKRGGRRRGGGSGRQPAHDAAAGKGGTGDKLADSDSVPNSKKPATPDKPASPKKPAGPRGAAKTAPGDDRSPSKRRGGVLGRLRQLFGKESETE